jgi:hypothetical protein
MLPADGGGARDAAQETAPSVATAAIATGPVVLSPAKRFVVIGTRSRLDVHGHDSVLGDHSLTIKRWWAHIEPDPAKIVVHLDLRSIDSDESLVTSIVKTHMLEVDRWDHATLEGFLSTTTTDGVIVIDGIADVHGKRVPLRFSGRIRREGDRYRFAASFDMSRRAFDLSYAPAEPFLDDVFRVSVDAIATPERVEVQEGG